MSLSPLKPRPWRFWRGIGDSARHGVIEPQSTLNSRQFAKLGINKWRTHCRLKVECVWTRESLIRAFLSGRSGRRMRYGSGGTVLWSAGWLVIARSRRLHKQCRRNGGLGIRHVEEASTRFSLCPGKTLLSCSNDLLSQLARSLL